MDTIGENGDPVERIAVCNELNSGTIKVNGEINGSYTEPMEVEDEDEVIPVKKMTGDINLVGDILRDENKEVNEEAEETDELGVVPICEVPDVDENISSNGFREDCNEKNNEHVSMDDSHEVENYGETEKVDEDEDDDDDSCQVISSDPLKNNDTSLDGNDSNFGNSQSSVVAIDTMDTSDCTPIDLADPLADHNGLEECEDEIQNQNKHDVDNPTDNKNETEDVSLIDEENNTSDVQCTDDLQYTTECSEKTEDLTGEKSKSEDDILDCTPDKAKKTKKIQQPINVTPRRSSRNLNKQKSYIEKEDELKDLEIIKTNKKPNDDPDIEEITPVDPLAADPVIESFRDRDNNKFKMSKKTTIVVNDTKKLVEIASGSKHSKANKKEPTLVIIDTNSILSGRGPIPLSSSQSSIPGPSRNQGYSVLPVALPAQGMYPQMRTHPQVKTVNIQSPQQSISVPSLQMQSQTKPPIILPSLTDDMYVVEAPSFIVPYVYEKPPIKPLKDYVNQIEQAIKEIKEHLEKEKIEQQKKDAEAKADEAKPEKDKNDIQLKDSIEEGSEKEDKEKVDDMKMEVDEESSDKNSTPVEKQSKELKDSENKMEVDNEKGCDNKNEICDDKNKDDTNDKSDVDSNITKEKPGNEPKESIEKTNDDIENKVCDNNSKTSVDEKVKEQNENSKPIAVTEEKTDLEKNKKTGNSYFDNPLGKFFIQIGVNLVQEHVQTDLLRSQKRKKDRDGSNCAPEVQMAITSLIRTLEFSKENNEPFRLEQKKCEFCSFKTESMLVMAHHLETPHMRNYVYRCNFCPLEVRSPHDILFHMEAEHNVRGRLERAPAFHQCPSCPFEDNQKGKLTRHLLSCAKKYRPERNQEPPLDFEPPAKIPRISRNRPSMSPGNAVYQAAMSGLKQGGANHPLLPKLVPSASPSIGQTLLNRGRGRPQMINRYIGGDMRPTSPLTAQQKAMATAAQIRPGMLYRPSGSNAQPQVLLPTSYQLTGNQMYQNSVSSQKSSSATSGGAGAAAKLLQQPSISITPLPRQQATPTPNPTPTHGKPGRPLGSGKATFVICEICDGYIKDLEQLRNHMQWIHKVKIHPKMIYNRPPLNCQKCQFRFFTDQGLERHLLGSHGLVTSSMQEAANRGKDGGRCPVCGRVYQWKLLNHVARDHNMSLKPAHLSYKCTVCTATFGMYKQFENHVYSAHSVVAKRVIDKKPAGSSQPSTSSSSHQGDSLLKPLKINDEITIIPQPVRNTKPLSKPGPSSRSGPQSSKGKV